MKRQVVNLPSPSRGTDLPYSPAIVATGTFVFTSGYVGFDPKTGNPPGGIAAQTEQSLENLKAVLEAAGSSLAHVVKVNVYLADVEDYDGMNTVYRRYFPTDRPARATLGAKLVRPDLLVEIEMVALLNPGAEA
jgi:2-iminobutanoate/2-iminopropanoate deaminase